MRDHFALEPGQVGIDCQHDQNEDHDLDDRDDEERVLGQELAHGLACASGRDCSIEQKRPSVPLVKRLSFAERIKWTATSYGAWPFFENCNFVGSAPPVRRPAGWTL